MSKWGAVDTRNLQKLQKLMEQLSAQDLDEFCRAGAKELAARLLRKVKKRTPVGQYPKGSGQTGGTLRRGWTIDFDIVKVGNEYEITVINPVEYASYVEFGHRTRGGRGWVKGRFMMTESEIELESQAPRILERKLEKLLMGVLSGK